MIAKPTQVFLPTICTTKKKRFLFLLNIDEIIYYLSYIERCCWGLVISFWKLRPEESGADSLEDHKRGAGWEVVSEFKVWKSEVTSFFFLGGGEDICLFIYVCLSIFLCLSVCLYVCVSVFLYACLSTCLSDCFNLRLSVCLCMSVICLYVYLFVLTKHDSPDVWRISLNNSLSICLSIHSSIYQSLVFVRMHSSLSVSKCLFVCLSMSFSFFILLVCLFSYLLPIILSVYLSLSLSVSCKSFCSSVSLLVCFLPVFLFVCLLCKTLSYVYITINK